MVERAAIVGKDGDTYSIELSDCDRFFSMKVFRGELPVGYARCIVEGEHVKLADIKIEDKMKPALTLFVTLLGPFRKLLVKNYQSRGLGSKLLKEVIAYSREIGAASIYGSMHGDWGMLSKWYSQHGFEVDSSTGRILLRLDTAVA